MTTNEPVHIAYFSDVLCIWAYAAQIRLDELRQQFGERVWIDCHYIPVFGDTASRIGEGWRERGGFEAYARHVQEIAGRFDHITVHPEAWRDVAPASSASCHLFLKAAALATEDAAGTGHRGVAEELAWQFRRAFFEQGRDIAQREVQLELAVELDLSEHRIVQLLDKGTAFAALCRDLELRDRLRLEGSPTFVLNDGRQKLYGNIGYRVIEANVQELLRQPDNRASWC